VRHQKCRYFPPSIFVLVLVGVHDLSYFQQTTKKTAMAKPTFQNSSITFPIEIPNFIDDHHGKIRNLRRCRMIGVRTGISCFVSVIQPH
jgi:hypothetical protein